VQVSTSQHDQALKRLTAMLSETAVIVPRFGVILHPLAGEMGEAGDQLPGLFLIGLRPAISIAVERMAPQVVLAQGLRAGAAARHQ